MTDLNTGRLVYDGVSFAFGDGTPYVITAFQRGVAEYESTDRALLSADGRVLGRAFKSGPTHELGLAVIGDGGTEAEREASVRERVRELARVWSAVSLREQWGAVAELHIGGLSAYGQPRDFVPEDAWLWAGTAEPVMRFAALDDLWYGDALTTSISLVPPVSGGLTFPAVPPFTFDSGPTVRNGSVLVGGVAPAWPVFEIAGPVTDPEIEVPGVGRLVFRTTLAYDQALVIDTRPHARWVKRNGAPLPGALSPGGSRLSDMRLKPGAHTVMLRGYDPSGTAVLKVTVAPAYPSF